VELQGRVKELRRHGLNVAAISYDPVSVLTDFAARRHITFPLLSDVGSATITRYGILNTTVSSTSRLGGLPFPGTFVLDRRGVVTARFFEQNYQERDTAAGILTRLGGDESQSAVKISAPPLTILSSVTDSSVALGTNFSLVLDVRPAAGVHVYAPGVTGYAPIALSIDPRSGLLVKDAVYPASEDYHFKPLNEHVPVFQRPFRIVQDVAIDPTIPGQVALDGVSTVTITGNLTYQACDDRVCFPPRSVPLTWKVALRPLDLERARK
jgi:hypothetical protein